MKTARATTLVTDEVSWPIVKVPFWQRLIGQQPDAPPTRTEIVAQIVKSQRCHCGGTCAHCRHIIADVLGR